MEWTSRSSEELIRACVQTGETAAWQEFVRRFRPVVAATVMRTSRRHGAHSPALLDDLIQETFLKLCSNDCRILRDFVPQSADAAYAFMKTVASSVAQDYFRTGMAVKRGAGRHEAPLDPNVESTAGYDALPDAEREILIHEIDETLKTVVEPATRIRDRGIFWLYYRQGMTARAISRIAGVDLTPKGVESVLQRLIGQVRAILVQQRAQKSKGKSSASSF